MRSMRGEVQGRDTSVRGIISKGRFVQGAQHPRTLGRGHIGRGHINPASKDRYMEGIFISNSENSHTFVGLKNQDCVKQGLLCIF
jgi:hypothetical protein